jgi:hypothetical protein
VGTGRGEGGYSEIWGSEEEERSKGCKKLLNNQDR